MFFARRRDLHKWSSPMVGQVCDHVAIVDIHTNRLIRMRTESIPDITPLLKPTTLGDFATYFFASAGGLFLGGELGKT